MLQGKWLHHQLSTEMQNGQLPGSLDQIASTTSKKERDGLLRTWPKHKSLELIRMKSKLKKRSELKVSCLNLRDHFPLFWRDLPILMVRYQIQISKDHRALTINFWDFLSTCAWRALTTQSLATMLIKLSIENQLTCPWVLWFKSEKKTDNFSSLRLREIDKINFILIWVELTDDDQFCTNAKLKSLL